MTASETKTKTKDKTTKAAAPLQHSKINFHRATFIVSLPSPEFLSDDNGTNTPVVEGAPCVWTTFVVVGVGVGNGSNSSSEGFFVTGGGSGFRWRTYRGVY